MKTIVFALLLGSTVGCVMDEAATDDQGEVTSELRRVCNSVYDASRCTNSGETTVGHVQSGQCVYGANTKKPRYYTCGGATTNCGIWTETCWDVED